jgi:hypothetical protein
VARSLRNSHSYKRRKIEIEFSQHYNGQHTPFDEFGKTLYDDWDKEQWLYFDIFMINCVQSFLKHGIIEPTIKNIPLRKLRQETSEEFAKFAQLKLSLLEKNGKEYPLKKILLKFVEDYPHFENYKWFTQNKFNKWLKYYGTLFNYSVQFRFSNNINYISFTNVEDNSTT